MLLFHTGFSEIPSPDVAHGRRNADFGPGFYLSDSEAFSRRWARERSGSETVVNRYELETEGLLIREFQRDGDWFEYISRNRAGFPDSLKDYDVIAGPIANDTIYDTWGILTSGLLPPQTALQLLCLGNEYRQIVIKTERATKHLRFLSAYRMNHEEISSYRETVRQEERAYQLMIRESLGDLLKMIES